MKRIITIVAALVLTSAAANAQKFSTGDMKVNLGYSIIGGEFHVPSDMSDFADIINPISLGLDYGLIEINDVVLSAGLQLSFNTVSSSNEISELLGIESVTETAIIPAVRLAANWSPISMLNLKGGLLLGYSLHFVSVDDVDMSDEDFFAWTPYIGADLLLFNGFGVYAELGYGNTAKPYSGTVLNGEFKENGLILNVGLTYKF